MKEQEPNSTESLTKCGIKPHTFYALLLKKKRISCLQANKSKSIEIEELNSEDLNTDNLEPKHVSDLLKGVNSKDPQIPGHKETSTNVALCCAITESTYTPSHICSECPTKGEIHKVVKKSVFQRMSGIKAEDIKPISSCLPNFPKPRSVVNLSSLEKKAQIENDKKSHKRSFSLNRNLVSSASNMENLVSDKPSGTSSTCETSPESSVSPVHPHVSVRQKFLISQRSVDNILVNSPSCSPLSTRSAGNEPGKKKKKRPASVVVLSNQKHDSNDHANTRAPSMDSLARHSLLAAQVLHLIPANKARERNFLHGRIAANSLLGSIELERVLPKREVRIYVATWNMNGQVPPQGLNPLLLPDGLEHVPDIVAVGTQESYPERFQWEVTLQETLGPSHVLLHSAAFGTLHLALFIRRDLIWFSSVAEEASFSVRPGTAFRTKGALGIAFYLFGTSFLFITCHLTAHQEKVKERLQDIRKIVKSLELPKSLPCRHKGKDVTENFDYVLWCGDLNFRLSRPRSEVLTWITEHSFPLPHPPQNTPDDQLTTSLNNGNVLRGFKEGPLTFAPTYKYDPGTQNYDSSQKQRTPSYTDRILFKSCRNSSEALECLAYSSVPSVCTSDHKPVWGLYKCPVRPGIDTIPLAAGLFNREVYLEAIKRRAAAMDQREGSSTVCSIQ